MCLSKNKKFRCFGNEEGKGFYADYHDNEWGVPEHSDNKLFELLILEGAQAGLSWETILKKREGYRAVFHNFDPKKVATMTAKDLEKLRYDSRIIRNKLKIYSVQRNACVFLEIQDKYGSFDNYLWNFVNKKPIINQWNDFSEVPVTTPLSVDISKDLKRKGMTFVGPTIIYAYLQAVGVVNDHLKKCWKYEK